MNEKHLRLFISNDFSNRLIWFAPAGAEKINTDSTTLSSITKLSSELNNTPTANRTPLSRMKVLDPNR